MPRLLQDQHHLQSCPGGGALWGVLAGPLSATRGQVSTDFRLFLQEKTSLSMIFNRRHHLGPQMHGSAFFIISDTSTSDALKCKAHSSMFSVCSLYTNNARGHVDS